MSTVASIAMVREHMLNREEWIDGYVLTHDEVIARLEEGGEKCDG